MGDITDMNLATRLVHAGEDDYPLGAVAPPIFETASFRLEDFAARSRVTELPANTTFYSGISNPTVAALEVKLAAIESAGAALAFNSGMAAITTAVLAICRNGGHIIVSDKLFVVTDNWFREDLPALGCEVTVVLDGRTSTITIPPGSPVLDGAQLARPDLPFACKGGVCGTCRALLRSGEVRMRRNFALEQSEIDAGFVLTCQAVPASAELTVDYDA